ncbi:MAG TPA: hypothetical protein VGL86_10210 [Polyangia bacterium]|jgi:hypothetical protein
MRSIVTFAATLGATLALGAAGCHRGPTRCAPGTPSTLEVRNGSGALELAWKGDDLCNAELRPVGTLTAKAGTVTLTNAAGRLTLELTRESQTVGHGRDAAGPTLRLYRDARELRVLRADGVPIGSVAPQTLTGAVVYNPASAPLAKVSLRDRDAVVTDMAGTALTYVSPARDPAVAGVFGVPTLDPASALAIYIYWSR